MVIIHNDIDNSYCISGLTHDELMYLFSAICGSNLPLKRNLSNLSNCIKEEI